MPKINDAVAEEGGVSQEIFYEGGRIPAGLKARGNLDRCCKGRAQHEHKGRARKGEVLLGVSKEWGWGKGSTVETGRGRLRGDPGQMVEALMPGRGV